ncbi:MAG: transposase [Terrimicrobiaceae bacterium]
MPRKPRVEYAGAVYHVMDRGDRLETIFRDDADRELFLKTLGQACERSGWRVHSYVLMGNHYHKKSDLSRTAKGSAEKVALASFIRRRTMVTNGWLSKNLCMGDPSRVSRHCTAAKAGSDIQALVRKLEMSIGMA